MALNFKSGTDSQSAISASTNGDSVEVAGYSQVAIHLIFGTCTGATGGDTAAITIETSNDDKNYSTLGTIQVAAQGSTLSATKVYDYYPDNATANQIGFGRYIRFVCTVAGTVSITYKINWLAKE
jgi:hypothetical protein